MNRIFWIEPGKLAGRRYPSTEELRELHTAGFRILIPLEERDDYVELENIGFEVHPFEIKDFTAPTVEQLDAFNSIVKNSGEKWILVHCKGGYGRTGTMLASYLIKQKGYSANEAIGYVREQRPGAIEIPEQIAILLMYEDHCISFG